MRLDEFIARLEDTVGKNVKRAGSGFESRCPAHEDRQASLSVAEGDSGIVVKCFAGCSADDVVRAMGLDLKDLFDGPSQRPATTKREKTRAIPTEAPEATYDYVDERGQLVLRVVRFPGKQFRQCRPPREGDAPESIHEGMVWKLGEIRKPLYRLPELLQAVGQRKVFIVEGEKDVEAIYAAGGVATCNVGGAGGWREEYADVFDSAHVLIVVDKDDPGEKHAQQVADSLEDIAASVTLVQAREGKDAADHFAAGHGLADFAPYVPKTGIVLVQASTVVPRKREWVYGFENFIPYGGIAYLMGEPGTNKSTLSMLVAAIVSTKDTVVVSGAEDSWDAELRPRLEAAGATLDNVYFMAKREQGIDGSVTFPDDIKDMERALKHSGARLLVIDPIMAHVDGETDVNNDPSTRAAFTPLARLAERRNIAVLSIAHTNKATSGNPYTRAGGSIGIPGLARTGLLMGLFPEHERTDPNHPDGPPMEDDGRRILVSWKNNWGPKPKSRVYRLDFAAATGIDELVPKLMDFGTTWHRARHLLLPPKKGKGSE